MAADSAHARFWHWFRDNAPRLRAQMYGRDNAARLRAAGELRQAVVALQPGIVLEFGPGADEGPHQLIVSADGRPDRVNLVKDFVASAPALPGWEVVAFRPRLQLGDSLEIALGQETVRPGDVWFRVSEDDDGLNLTLHVRGLTSANENERGLAASLLAEHAVGERDALTLVSSLGVAPLPAGADGLRPFRELVGLFDREKQRRYPAPGALPLGADDNWQGMEGTVNGARALVLLNLGLRRFAGHPAYDRRLTVTIPFNQARPDGMPASEREYSAVQDIGGRVAEVLHQGQESLLALMLMTRGRRELVFYTADADAARRRLEPVRAEVETHRVETQVEWDTFWGMYRTFCQAGERKKAGQ